MLINVNEVVVVITGSSRGIGAELARAFAKEGSYVVINYKNSGNLARMLLDEISKYNKNCIAVKADISKKADVLKFYKTVILNYGRIDVLINNAGICDDDLIQMMNEEQWTRVINVNLTGTYLCCQEFSKIMMRQNSGKIINMSSLKGQEGCVAQTNYAASKAGIIGFTKSLAKELGKYNISVNAVCPGFITTDLNRYDSYKESVAKSKSLLSIDKCMDDLVNFIIYMASDMFSGVSGQVYNIDSRIL